MTHAGGADRHLQQPHTARPVVHLELRTPDQVRASAFYAQLLHWRLEVVRAAAGSYLAVHTGTHLGGGFVECRTRRPLWPPYVEADRVDRVDRSTERAREHGAVVLSRRAASATFPRGWPLSARKRWRVLRTGANSQPAVAGYLFDEQTGVFGAETIIALTFRTSSIEQSTALRSPRLFPLFGLPEQLAMRPS